MLRGFFFLSENKLGTAGLCSRIILRGVSVDCLCSCKVYAKACTTRRPLRASFNRLEGCGSRNRRLPLDRSAISNVYQLVVLFVFSFVYRVPVEMSTGTNCLDWFNTPSQVETVLQAV